MKRLYFRWGAISLAGLIVAILGLHRYEQEVITITPTELLQQIPSSTVRVLGMVKSGSLNTGVAPSVAQFDLVDDREEIPVQYAGGPAENLRELKKLVVVGNWNPSAGIFEAYEISLLPNYGYVVAAYLIGMIPIGFFVFRMERKVELLYTEIKGAKVYEPEEISFDTG